MEAVRDELAERHEVVLVVDAEDLKSARIRRYNGSRVIEFKGATGYWVRIDPPNHEHAQAEAILRWIGKPDPDVVPYLVRVD